jgi:lipoic acid synthetase
MSSKLKILNPLPENPEKGLGRFPPWLHYTLPKGGQLFQTDQIVKKYRLNTVCAEAKCPNRVHCFSHKTATFLAMGKECSRSCGFCSIKHSKQPKPLEADEPFRIAMSVKELGLKHVVITMVARDDLEDGGAAHLSAIIREIRLQNKGCAVEVLTSDFNGNFSSLDTVLNEQPDVFNYNIETVRSLTPRVRHKATYDRTLSILRHAKNSKKVSLIKSGLMVGLGEQEEEVFATLADLKEAGCDIVTIGHYLQPDRHKLRVKAFITPEQFKRYEDEGYRLGLKQVYSGPFVRSSFNAAEVSMSAQWKST